MWYVATAKLSPEPLSLNRHMTATFDRLLTSLHTSNGGRSLRAIADSVSLPPRPTHKATDEATARRVPNKPPVVTMEAVGEVAVVTGAVSAVVAVVVVAMAMVVVVVEVGAEEGVVFGFGVLHLKHLSLDANTLALQLGHSQSPGLTRFSHSTDSATRRHETSSTLYVLRGHSTATPM